MKRRKHVILSAILFFLLAIISDYSRAQDIYVQPSETDTSMSEFFSVDIMVRSVASLSTFELRVLFDKDILEGVSLAKGALWNDPDYLWHAGGIDNVSGAIGFTSGAASSGSRPFGINVDSNGGTLVTIIFQAVAKGTSTIGLTDVLIYDVDGNEINVNIIDGTVNSVNRQPVADDQSVTTSEDTPVSITLTGSDPDGDPLIYTVVSNPFTGSLSGTAPNLIYTLNPAQNGSDSFTFKVSDGIADSNIATVTITVEPLEDVSTMVRVDTTSPEYDESRSQLSMLATWTNMGPSQLSEPLRMVVESIKPSSVRVSNADGTTPGGKPYYDYSNSLGDGRLDPGETSGAKRLVLSGPGSILGSIKFTLDLSCWAHIDIDVSIIDSGIASAAIAVNTIDAPGWSLMSLPVQPSDMEPNSVLSSMYGKHKSSHVPLSAPGIPYRIWGDIEINGVKMIESDNPMVILKVNDKVYSSYKLGTVESYGDSYILDVPANATDSPQAEILVQIGDKMIEAGIVPHGRPGQVLRYNLSIKFPPKASMLYQNYPNPFNPETWIPYELSEAANVQIEIYSLSGQLVRKLDLGYRQPGFYKRREDAAYWDGKNGKGEKVASGIYFYTIKADGYSATRKMTVTR